VLREVAHPGGKSESMLSDGSRLISFNNGTRKRIYADASSVVTFPNGDRKQTEKDGRVLYYYHAADTTHTTFPDGMQQYEFGTNQQVEKHYVDGRREIFFGDGTIKIIDAQGNEWAKFMNDDTVQYTSAEEIRRQQQQQNATHTQAGVEHPS